MESSKITTDYKKRKHGKKSVAEIVFICVMLSVPVVHFCLFWVYINVDSVFLSFKQLDMNTGTWKFFGMGNYKNLLYEFTKPGSVLPRAILNSLSIFLWNDFIIVPISLVAAYFLYKKMPAGGFFKVVFFLPSIISVVVLTMTYMFMFDGSFGFLPTLLEKMGLGYLVPFDGFFGTSKTAWWTILIYGLWSGIGYNIVLISGAMTRIPTEVLEAGKLDGLTMGKELWHVVIPLIGSTIATLMLLGTTVIFTYFLQPKLILGSNAEIVGGYTLALYIVNNVKESGSSQMALGASVGIICAIVGTPIVVFARKLLDKFLPAYEY